MTKGEIIKDFFKKSVLPLFLLNFVIGGIIGGFILVWRSLVAAWYVPLTVYRLIASGKYEITE